MNAYYEKLAKGQVTRIVLIALGMLALYALDFFCILCISVSINVPMGVVILVESALLTVLAIISIVEHCKNYRFYKSHSANFADTIKMIKEQ